MSVTKLSYDPGIKFLHFLEQLRGQAQPEWQWLMDMFRAKVKPYLFKIDGNLPAGTIASVDEFIEEVFANSLFRFYEQFAGGQFQSLPELRSLMFRIAEFKLKEGYYRVRRDKLLYFTDDVRTSNLTEYQDDLSIREEQEREAILELRDQLELLNPTDKELLVRFAKGEELGSIALNLGLEAAACRKRKQRALDKLKILVINALKE
ncbi:MAG: DNA-directed RNA polymerase specialized sigma24 family protein [Paraglaciecola sp.]|jgi:DNA-directed RNA polymerase specialized sigma24 family protein